MNLLQKIFLVIIALTLTVALKAQQIKKEFTLREALKLATEQSPKAFMAKHRFRGNYWQYRIFKANLLPSLSLNATLPNLNRSLEKITLENGQDKFVNKQNLTTDMGLSLRQNIGFTGGVISINTDLSYLKDFNNEEEQYRAAPIFITLRQPLLAYNRYKWDKKIEPLKYEKAQKEYLNEIENIRKTTIQYFFNLVEAQINLQMANKNYSNNDTIYKIAVGRYNIGTIARNELLQTELNFLNSATALHEAKINLEERKFSLRSFLGFNESIDINLIIPKDVPDIEINSEFTIEQASNNNPQMLSYKMERLEAESSVAKARADKFSADLFVSYGLNQSAPLFEDVYSEPEATQQVRVGLSIPLLDWGRNKGNYLMARSNLELVNINVNQDIIDFKQNVKMDVVQFNMQGAQLIIAQKADTIANMKYEVTLQRFYIGKVDIVNLNIALNEKDSAKRKYISGLQKYWSLYYTLRGLALYDFIEKKPLTVDFDKLL